MAACSPTAHSSPTPCSIPTAAALRTRSPTPPSAHHLRYRLRGLFRWNPSLTSAAMDESGSAPIFPNVRTTEENSSSAWIPSPHRLQITPPLPPPPKPFLGWCRCCERAQVGHLIKELVHCLSVYRRDIKLVHCTRTRKFWLDRCRSCCCNAIHRVPLGCKLL